MCANVTNWEDPRFTSFAFNLPGTVSGISGFTSSLTGWGSSYSSNNIDTPAQFGRFDVAALGGPNFNGGTPNEGIARNATATSRSA